jgi:predicted nucleic acid-binding Zn ribbon protein
MRVDQMKIGRCEVCNTQMPIFNKRQRFCSRQCKYDWWQKERSHVRKAKVNADILGFGVAAE